MGRVFLTSSVSGGSVGVFHYVDNHTKIVNGDQWVETAAADEVLSPIAAWGSSTTSRRGCSTSQPIRGSARRTRSGDAGGTLIGRRSKRPRSPPTAAESPRLGDEPMVEVTADAPLTVFNGSIDGAKRESSCPLPSSRPGVLQILFAGRRSSPTSPPMGRSMAPMSLRTNGSRW